MTPVDDLSTDGAISSSVDPTGSSDADAVDSDGAVQPGTSAASGSSAPDAGSQQVTSAGATSPPPLEPPTVSTGDSMGALILLMTKLRSDESDASMKGMVQEINNRLKLKNVSTQSQLKELLKSHKAQAKAKKSGSLSKTFGWIGKALIVVAAVAAAVLLPGIGTALAALMIAGLVINEVMQIPAVNKALTNALGAKGMMALTIGIAALQLIGTIALTVMTGGAGGVAMAAEIEEISVEGGEAALEASETAAEAGAEGASESSSEASSGSSELSSEGQVDAEAEGEPEVDDDYGEGDDSMNNEDEGGDPGGKTNLEKLQTGARFVRTSSKVTGAGAKIAGDAEDMKTAGYQKDAEDADAAYDKFGAEIKRDSALNEQTQKLIVELLKRMEEIFSTAGQVISTEHETEKSVNLGVSLTSNA